MDRLHALELIGSGRVRSWAELGRSFGITGQAANQRFGKGTQKRPGYGLTMPLRERRYTRAVSVSLDEEMYELVERIRRNTAGRTLGRRMPSQASVLRQVIERHLSEDAGV
jgi:hypothetical protein